MDVSGRFRVAALGRKETAAVVAAGFLVATGRTTGSAMTVGAVLVVTFVSFEDHSCCFAHLDLTNKSLYVLSRL